MVSLRRHSQRLGWVLLVVYFVATGFTLWLAALNGEELSSAVAVLLAYTAFVGVGSLIISNDLRHTIGWAFIVVGLGAQLGNLLQQYATYTLYTSAASLPGGVAAAWVGNWLWPASIGVVIFLPYFFPDGKHPSLRWRPVLWMGGLGYLAVLVDMWFKPGLLDVGSKEEPIVNPLGIMGAPSVFKVLEASWVLLLLMMIAGVAALVVRGRRSRGAERQQFKWFGFAAAATVVLVTVLNPLAEVVFEGNLGHEISSLVFGLAVAAIPTATGIAILRYRLYDIDLIINRALVYGALTALLGASYVLMVTLASTLVPGSSLTTAAATLAVAALFRPLRSRIQSLIDHRFYGRKYDAVHTIQAFSERLREEVDLEALTADLLEVVSDTVQPAHASMWLRKLSQSRP